MKRTIATANERSALEREQAARSPRRVIHTGGNLMRPKCDPADHSSAGVLAHRPGLSAIAAAISRCASLVTNKGRPLLITLGCLSSAAAWAQNPLLPNDIRISEIGDEQDLGAFPLLERPALAYNSVRDEMLAGWIDNSGNLEISRVDRPSGFVVPSIRIETGDSIKQVGPSGSVDLSFNPLRDEYHLVWQRRGSSFGVQHQEVRACVISGIGAIITCDDVFSDPPEIFELPTSARRPSLAYDPATESILVAFQWDQQCIAAVLLDAVNLTGGGDEAPCIGTSTEQEARPHVAFNSASNEYLVVWHDERFVEGVLQFQIWARRLNAAGTPIGSEFRVSDAALLNSAIDAVFPDVTYNAQRDEFFVVWAADDTDAGLVNAEFEIFGQRLDSAGAELGMNDQRLTTVGGTGSASSDAGAPQVKFDGHSGNYLLTWYADDPDFSLNDEEFEIFVATLDGDSGSPLAAARRLSDLGPSGDAVYVAAFPVSALTGEGHATVAWWGRERIFGIGPFDFWDEQEIFAQSLELGFFQDGFESGDLSNWEVP